MPKAITRRAIAAAARTNERASTAQSSAPSNDSVTPKAITRRAIAAAARTKRACLRCPEQRAI